MKPVIPMFVLVWSLLVSCEININTGPGIEGTGPTSSQKWDLSDFDQIKFEVAGSVELKKGPFAVEGKGQQNILENLDITVRKGVLIIDQKKRVKQAEDLVFQVSLPSLKGLTVAGSGSITGMDDFSGIEQLDLTIGGSGEIQLECSAEAIDANIGGSGSMSLSGYTNNLDINIGGSGEVDANKLEANQCSITIGGSGDVRVHAVQTLDISMAGSGDVYYKGNPKVST